MPEYVDMSGSVEDTSSVAQKFRKVSEIANLIHNSQDLEDVLQRLTEGVCMHSEWSTSSIQALDMNRKITMPIVRYDPFRPHSEALMREWEASESPLVRIVETGKPLIMPDASDQDDYPNFRNDAQYRGYRTAVLIPLKFPDAQGRAIVFSVYAFERIEVSQAEMGFLQCVADLADLAVRRMQALERESAEAQSMRDIFANLTDALASTLDWERSEDFLGLLSRLFPSTWFAVDLTTGRTLVDKSIAWPELDAVQKRTPDAIVRLALQAKSADSGESVTLWLNDSTPQRVQARGLDIDGSRVGALFLLNPHKLTPQQEIVVQAGQLALSTMLLRNYVAFRIRGQTAQRLLKRLFDKDLINQEELLEEARLLDFSLDQGMRLLAIRCPQHEPLDDGAYSFVVGKVQQSFGHSIYCVLKGTMYFLLHDNDNLDNQKLREAFLARIRPAIPASAAITLSDSISEPNQISYAHEVCHRNLKIAESMGAKGWISGQNIGALTTLMASLSETIAEDFLSKVIEPIADGGSRKGRTALETLSAYLASGRRLQESADKLCIHVSTMRYRIERLSERHDLNLVDSAQCFELELALRLHRLRNSYKP